MSVVTISNNRYSIDSPLYQWDLNQILEITGLSLSATPEIHFANSGMDRAIVRQASMDSAGVITAYIPNSLLQTSGKLIAYVCVYIGNTFETLYTIELLVKARAKPNDYTFEDDGDIYSFNALENLVKNTVASLSEVAFSGDYNDLVNVPTSTDAVTSVNGKTGAVILKTSDLTNDAGYITGYSESDPTVPAWAKAAKKPTYTAAEVGAIPSNMIFYAETLPDTGTDGQICLIPI